MRSPFTHIAAATIVSLAASIGSVWLIGGSGDETSLVRLIAILVMLLASYIVPALVIGLTLYQSFQLTISRPTRFFLVVQSYASLLFVFSGVYFSMAFAGDRDFAVANYFYYQAGGQYLSTGRIAHLNAYPGNSRAFIGMDEMLWGTLDDSIPRGVYAGLTDVERYRASLAVRLPFEQVVTFRKRGVVPVLADCFHLSVTTITTVGYGDVAPHTWYARLATDVEALSGTLLLVLALGLVFSDFQLQRAQRS